MKIKFNSRAQTLYVCLCKIFGFDEKQHVPAPFVFMMAQIWHYGLSSIFYFASFLAKEIYNGLIGIGKGKLDKPFG